MQVIWPEGKYKSANVPQGGTMRERLAKAHSELAERAASVELLKKAELPMRSLLAVRLANRVPLTVKRDFMYKSSGLEGSDQIDDGFYKRSTPASKFVDQSRLIKAGTVLNFQQHDQGMRELVFNDQNGQEHGISIDQTHLLLVNTDIYETVRNFLQGE